MSGIFDQIINYSPPLIVSGTVNYKGTWNASTNNPPLSNPPVASTKGDYYVVSTAGTQFGITFGVGDWIISNGTAWEKVDLTDAVSSVFGRTGSVVGDSTDYSAVGLTNTAIGASSPSTGAFTSLSSSSTTTLNNTTIPASKTLVVTTDKLSALAATTSAELAGVISDETGSGSLVFANSPTLVTPILGTPQSGTLTSCTGLPISTGVSGLGTGVATALAVNVGSAGAPVVNGGALGTPSSGTVTNLTGTASININGTVGATTPSTGAFTTLSSTTGANFATSSGNVGIGTTNPQTVLDIGSLAEGRSITWNGNNSVGSSYSQGALSLLTGLKMNTAADGYLVSSTGTFHHAGIRVADYTSTGNISFFNEATTARTADDVFDYVAATKMVITPAGNVGIGTTSPTQKLDVFGADNANLIMSRNSNGTSSMRIQSNAAANYIVSAGAIPLILDINGSERLRIDSSGNVGIGTASPASKLDVINAGGTGISTRNAETDYSIMRLGTDPTNAYSFIQNGKSGSGTTLDLAFRFDSSERMRITAAGNVGIGTADQFGGGVKVVGLANATTVPASNPTGGGVLYVESGALKYRGSSGTVTTIANA